MTNRKIPAAALFPQPGMLYNGGAVLHKEDPMKKPLQAAAAALILTAGVLSGGCGSISILHTSWEGTWWGVQDAGRNWSGDEIQNLEIFTFTENGDIVTVEHRSQRGRKEITGFFNGIAHSDGARLIITPDDGGRDTVFTYSRVSRAIETSLTNADGSAVVLQELTPDNAEEVEKIRRNIARVASREENRIDTTLSRR